LSEYADKPNLSYDIIKKCNMLNNHNFFLAINSVSRYRFKKICDLLYNAGRLDDLRELIHSIEQSDVMNFNHHLAMMEGYSFLEDYDRAIHHVDQAVEMTRISVEDIDNHITSLKEKGKLLEQLQKPDKAMISYEEALLILKENQDTFSPKKFTREMYYLAQNLGKVDLAIEMVDKLTQGPDALEKEPSMRIIYLADKASYLKKLGRIPEARAVYEEILENENDDTIRKHVEDQIAELEKI
jgi:tetratricopeptide (TPR) repeat protein